MFEELQTLKPDKAGARQGVCNFAPHVYAQYNTKLSFNVFILYILPLPVCRAVTSLGKEEIKVVEVSTTFCWK